MNKQQAFDLFEAKRREFLDYCRWMAKRIYQRQGHITIDDVRQECPLPSGIDGRVYGAIFNTDEWEKTGYTQTTRKTSHGRPIAYWRFVGTFREPRVSSYEQNRLFI